MGTSCCVATATVTGTGGPLPRAGAAFSGLREQPVWRDIAAASNQAKAGGRTRAKAVVTKAFSDVRMDFKGSLGFVTRFPPSAQRLVERDEIHGNGALALGQRVLGLKE